MKYNTVATRSLESKKLKSVKVSTNQIQGSYRPYFFDLKGFNLSKADYSSHYFNESEVEHELLRDSHSFYYLREDKLRTIGVFDNEGKQIKFNSFLKYFGININSQNLFKTGKYLSRVFRPVRYGAFYSGLDVFVNDNPSYKGAVTDGISLISLDLAKSLGWKNAKPEMSAQFTYFYNGGLVKGHSVISDKIKHDIVIYGEENIKSEITFSKAEYVALEPVKLGRKLRLDIQSLLNLWQVFTGEQYLQWAYQGIEQFKKDLFNGRLSEWLDNIDQISGEDYENEKWTLRKAIYHDVDYTSFPGLLRSAWTMFRNSMKTFSENSKGDPVFRIPVPGGKRGYLRVDLRDHDSKGNFKPTVEQGEVDLDSYGNLWVHPDDTNDTFGTLGGADQDDLCAVIPVEDKQAIIYRNPNQYGEVVLKKISFSGIDVKVSNKVMGILPRKSICNDKSTSPNICPKSENNLLDRFLSNLTEQFTEPIEYTLPNLLKTFDKIQSNVANVGLAANAEMIKSAIKIESQELFDKLSVEYRWNLERIIDSTVKDGTSAEEDMFAVNCFFKAIESNNILLPKTLLHRLPKSLRESIEVNTNHQLDQLFDAVNYLIEKADKEIMGSGSVSRGNRIPGKIDNLNIPIMEIGLSNINNPMQEAAITLMKKYNRTMAILLENTKSLPKETREQKRIHGIEKIQSNFLKWMNQYSDEECCLITKSIAYETYKGNRSVHDSILWISDKDDMKGTASDTIEMLADIGVSCHVKKNGSVERYYQTKTHQKKISKIRIWSRKELKAERFNHVKSILVEDRKALVQDQVLTVGDECQLDDGIYSIKNVVQSTSLKRKNVILKNSITLYLG